MGNGSLNQLRGGLRGHVGDNNIGTNKGRRESRHGRFEAPGGKGPTATGIRCGSVNEISVREKVKTQLARPRGWGQNGGAWSRGG